MLTFSVAVTVGSALLALASTPLEKDQPVIRHARPSVPVGFVASGTMSPSHSLELRIGLTSRNASGLQSRLYEVSTPSSPNYGQYLSVDEVNSYLSPTEESVEAVRIWLKTNGLVHGAISPSGEWISLTVPVGDANKLLNANYEEYRQESTGKTLVRTLSYSLPSNLSSHVDVVHPTTTFDLLPDSMSIALSSNHAASRDVPSSCDPSSAVTPTCIMDLYGIPKTAATQKDRIIGVTSFGGANALYSDLSLFLETYRPDMNPNVTFAVQSISGGVNNQSGFASYEAALDLEFTVGIATGVPVTSLPVGNSSGEQGFITSLVDVNDYLLHDKNRPQVITTSYGVEESSVSPDLSEKICRGFMALGALGTSVIFASGDAGVSGAHASGSCTAFAPTWPSVCPFVTSVGGTMKFPEEAASFSSGGFSNHFSRPQYQSSAVSSYLSSLGSINSGLYNQSGRAFPDVSAYSIAFPVTVNGGTLLISGTLGASPIFASVIGLINDRRAASRKPPLGFLNPFLYDNPNAFNDITIGNNPGCNTTGFPAIGGWDAVTGLGTPNFHALLAAASA